MDIVERVSDVLGVPAGLLRRTAVTLVAAGLTVVLGFVPLPGIEIARASFAGLERHPLTVGALGLSPFVLAFVLVEIVGMVWPGSPGSRALGSDRPARMGRIALVVGVLVAVAHAAGMARYWFSVMPSEMMGLGPVLGAQGPLAVTAAVSSLVAGASLYVLAAYWVRARGLGDGFAVLLGVGMVWRAIPASQTFNDWLRSMSLQRIDVFAVLGNVLAVAVTILATLWVVTRLETWVLGERSGAGRSGPERGASTPFHVPTAGILPFSIGSSLLWLLWTIRRLSSWDPVRWFGQNLETTSFGGSLTYFIQEFTIVVVLGVVGGWLFARIDSRYASQSGERLQSMRRRAQIVSVAFVAGLVVLDVFGGALLRTIGVVNLVLVTAIAVDLRREWKFRRAFPQARLVESVHRTGAVGPVLERLAEAGVPALARSRGYRGLLRWFAAYTPVEIVVPEACGDEAEAALEEMGGDA